MLKLLAASALQDQQGNGDRSDRRSADRDEQDRLRSLFADQFGAVVPLDDLKEQVSANVGTTDLTFRPSVKDQHRVAKGRCEPLLAARPLKGTATLQEGSVEFLARPERSLTHRCTHTIVSRIPRICRVRQHEVAT